MNIESLPDLENHIRLIESEDKVMQANLEGNLREITSRINLKSVAEQIVKEAKEDPRFLRTAAMAGAVLLIDHLPKKLGGGTTHTILSTLLKLAPASKIASVGEKASDKMLSWIQN